ncbi:MAG TPA: hypothetical protein ENN66_06720, partial [Proteobacteria bacterium]|nr:hypothetical protein [Pseudomonadota bacterium]
PPPFLLAPGSLLLNHGRLFVGCGQNSALRLERLQTAGKPARSAEEFICGYKPRENDFFGAR